MIVVSNKKRKQIFVTSGSGRGSLRTDSLDSVSSTKHQIFPVLISTSESTRMRRQRLPRYPVLVALEVLVSVCFCAQEPVGVPLVERMLRSLPNLVPRVFWLFGPFGYEIVDSLA